MKNKEKETTLLDSSLNTGHKIAQSPYLPIITTYKNYNIKVIDCKDYKQLYIFSNNKTHKIGGLEEKTSSFDINDLIDTKNYKNDFKNTSSTSLIVLYKNVMRSKIKLQRIAKTNEKEWKTFITLTFKENIKDLSLAYNKFRYFVKSVQKYKNDFKWLCVPEFQKNGRVHYHLVTNIDLEDTKLLYTQILEDGSISYHLKHWSKSIDKYTNLPTGKGYDCIEPIKDKEGNDSKKLCGYISKYMTKSYIEDCFYNKNRYYLSQNLELPIENYIDFSNKNDALYYQIITENYDIIFDKQYKDTFGNDITFIELKKK